MSEPRAKTPEELRDEFMDACRSVADYWARPETAPEYTCAERIQGALHSWLCIIDGVSMGFPAVTLTADPHPDDKEFLRGEGEDWIEPGTGINEKDYLHDLLYTGMWAHLRSEPPLGGSRPEPPDPYHERGEGQQENEGIRQPHGGDPA